MESPSRSDGLLHFLTKDVVEQEMRLAAIRTKYFYLVTYVGMIQLSAWITCIVATIVKLV